MQLFLSLGYNPFESVKQNTLFKMRLDLVFCYTSD